jgi:hypothetical protein
MELRSLLVGLFLVFLIYILSTAAYRLFLSPISHFPGPRLAALTFWYEGYHDVIRDGRYTWKIKELHEKYGKLLIASDGSPKDPFLTGSSLGPIVRINPCELHINDADFYHVLYSGASRRTDKWLWSAKMFG